LAFFSFFGFSCAMAEPEIDTMPSEKIRPIAADEASFINHSP
jgi:hypothetical protein